MIYFIFLICLTTSFLRSQGRPFKEHHIQINSSSRNNGNAVSRPYDPFLVNSSVSEELLTEYGWKYSKGVFSSDESETSLNDFYIGGTYRGKGHENPFMH
jgi:hypothetical protein